MPVGQVEEARQVECAAKSSECAAEHRELPSYRVEKTRSEPSSRRQLFGRGPAALPYLASPDVIFESAASDTRASRAAAGASKKTIASELEVSATIALRWLRRKPKKAACPATVDASREGLRPFRLTSRSESR